MLRDQGDAAGRRRRTPGAAHPPGVVPALAAPPGVALGVPLGVPLGAGVGRGVAGGPCSPGASTGSVPGRSTVRSIVTDARPNPPTVISSYATTCPARSPRRAT